MKVYKGTGKDMFSSPCGGKYFVSQKKLRQFTTGFRPLAGCKVFLQPQFTLQESYITFPSPCGVWVVSTALNINRLICISFRPLAGCGLFRRT